jgi:predicted N-acyltransferase
MPFGIEAGFAPSDKVEAAVGLMDNAWPGFQIILGLPKRGPDIPGWSWKRHLPGVVFRCGYRDFGEYLAGLRHNYRKLVNRSLRKWNGIRVSLSDGSDFGEVEYRQYLSVLGRQRFRTEALDKGFFVGIPVDHVYIKAYSGPSLISWILLVPFGSELYALFLGVDRTHNEEHHSYFNIFLETIKYAIGRGYRVIHFGQTAEFAKMRLGGEPVERYILVRHTNRAINAVIRSTDIFNYRIHQPDMHVMKRDGRDGR